MRNLLVLLFALTITSMAHSAEGPFRAEALKESPPATLSPAIRTELLPQGYRVFGPDNNPYVDIWLRKAVPASGKPNGPNGTVLFPFLGEGVLLGAVRYVKTGQDYRDQAIKPGVYTLRYGLQPQNGAHLGASDYRDFGLLLPASKDLTLAALEPKPLSERSAESVGTSHPGILMLLTPAVPSNPGSPELVEDAFLGTWGINLALPLTIKEDAETGSVEIQLVVAGAAMP